MKIIKKRIIPLVIFFVSISMMMSIAVNAAQPGTASPQWDNTAMVTCLIGFQDATSGSAEAHVMGHFAVNKITADVYVYVESGTNWVYVADGHKTVNNSSLTISCPFTAVSSCRYRADYTFVVTKNGVDETITQTIYRTNPY